MELFKLKSLIEISLYFEDEIEIFSEFLLGF